MAKDETVHRMLHKVLENQVILMRGLAKWPDPYVATSVLMREAETTEDYLKLLKQPDRG